MNLYVLDKNFKVLTIIDQYKSLIWTDRYDKPGDFELELSAGAASLQHIQEDCYIWWNKSEHHMIVESISIETDVDDGNHVTISGRSLESILDRRIVWGQTNLKGGLQAQLKALLTNNIISPSDTNRKIANFIFEDSTDETITALTIDTQFTGDGIDEVVETLCQSDGIGYKILLDSQNRFVFGLYAGADRSYNQTANPYAVFSPKFDNLVSSNYYHSKETYKNVTLVAGEGEGSDRKMLSVGTESGLERRELFTDANDISSTTDGGTLTTAEYNALLTARGNEKLAENTVSTAFEGEVEMNRPFQYGKDFNVGDIVQIVNEYGVESQVRIVEIVMSDDETGFTVYPTFEAVV